MLSQYENMNNITPKKSQLKIEQNRYSLYYDRHIPVRDINDFISRFELENLCSNQNQINNLKNSKEVSKYQKLLQAELFSEKEVAFLSNQKNYLSQENTVSPTKMFTYQKLPKRQDSKSIENSPISPLKLKDMKSIEENNKQIFSNSRKLIKVFMAPSIQDDFYSHTLDWSIKNQICLALGNRTYIYDLNSQKILEIPSNTSQNHIIISSTAFMNEGNLIIIGDHKGQINLWDLNKVQNLISYHIHTDKITSFHSKNKFIFASSSKDGTVKTWDLRDKKSSIINYEASSQGICRVKWSRDDQFLALGGNDNQVKIFNEKMLNPYSIFRKHKAAIRALSWDPNNYSTITSGGGKEDGNLINWNIYDNHIISCQNSKSQICDLLHSITNSEIISSHGYGCNEIQIRNSSDLNLIDILKEHQERVLSLCLSPKGDNIASLSVDETLMIWNVFPAQKNLESSSPLKEEKLSLSIIR